MSPMLQHLTRLYKRNYLEGLSFSGISLDSVKFDDSSELGQLLEGYRDIVLLNPEGFLKERELLEGIASFVSQGNTLQEAPGDEIDQEDAFDPDFSSEDPPSGGDEDPLSEPPMDFDGPREDGAELDDNGQSTFADEYPKLDEASVLEACYNEWLERSRSKPFYKVIKAYNANKEKGSLNPTDRIFLWKFIKSISSTITHLIIEVETHPEAICLMDKYFDGLMQCLNTVIHASDTEDVMTSFRYMVEFLGISNSEQASSDEHAEEDAEI